MDRDDEGGGVILAVKRSLSNIAVCTKIKIKIGVIYMPQESRTKLDTLKEIYQAIEREIEEAAENGFSLLVVGDLNCKVGGVINGNTEDLSKGGRLLLKMGK